MTKLGINVPYGALHRNDVGISDLSKKNGQNINSWDKKESPGLF